MKKQVISLIIVGLIIATTSVIITAESDVSVIFAYTTDYVNDWQDTGLRIKEWPIDGEVYAYIEVGADDLYGKTITHRWWYDNGTGLTDQWDWNWEIPEHWTSAWSYTYWQIGLDFGPGYGYIEVLADGESIGKTNYFAMANHAPDTPTITGPSEGITGESTDYKFAATDPDGFDIFLCVDWGDGENEVCHGPFPSGEEQTLSHIYAEDGEYTITCKAKDIVDSESGLAQLAITMPKAKTGIFNLQFIENLFERFPNAFPILRYIIGL